MNNGIIRPIRVIRVKVLLFVLANACRSAPA
jgi:hypothetical protein